MSGEQLALDGMACAEAHANRVHYNWSAEAERHIIAYAMAAKGPFSIEQVRRIAYATGLDRPPAEGAWGAPTKRLVKRGVIEFAGYQTSANASQHCKPVKLWTSIYSEAAQ